jgi:ABC-type Zn uptake system ZnuABC Zn-binding protein ZnuA
VRALAFAAGLAGSLLLGYAVYLATSSVLGAQGGFSVVTVIVETPGLGEDLRMLGCGLEAIIPLAAGGDHHSAQLPPGAASLIAEADLVVVVPDSPAGVRAAELAPPGATVIIISELAPASGGGWSHIPHYNPEVLASVLRAAAEAMARANQACAPVYREALENFLARLGELGEAAGSLEGWRAVADFGIYEPLEAWLGFEVEAYIAPSPEAHSTPGSVEEALRLVGPGTIVVVMVDGEGRPVSRAGETLLSEAEARGAPVLLVEAPWTPKPTILKLEQIASQALLIAGG